MSNTLKFGNGQWATKEGSTLAYNDENNNFKPLPFNFERASSATFVNKDGLIETVGSDMPRVDYKDDSEGALLLEPQRSNLVSYSNKFDTYWSLNGLGTGSAPTIINNSIISPDGTQNATEVVLNVGSGTTTSDRSSIEVSQTVSQGSDYSISFYIKGKNNGDQLMIGSISGGYELITLTTEWKRYQIKQVAASSPRSVFLGIRQGVFGTLNNYVEFYLYGAQLEQGSYATSYIPTQGGAVTRFAEVCNNGGNEQVINSTEGVLYAEVSTTIDSDFKSLSLSDGSVSNGDDNRVMIGFQNSILYANVRVGNVYQFNENLTIPINNMNKIALKYKQNDFALWINGSEVRTDNNGTTFPANTLKSLQFTDGRPETSPLNGNVKDLRVYNTALTDQELQALTQV